MENEVKLSITMAENKQVLLLENSRLEKELNV